VSKLPIEADEACLAIHDETVRNVHPERIQAVEIWLFCCAKDKNVRAAKEAAVRIPSRFAANSLF